MKKIISILKRSNSHWLLLLLLLMSKTRVNAQYNLVPNAGFESYVSCPAKLNNYPPPPWYNACKKAGTYCNSCCTDIYASVPYNVVGGFSYQYTRNGNGYVLVDYVNGNQRTYIQIKLKDSLRKDKYYYAEHFVNSPNSQTLGCNNVAMLFTDTAIYSDPFRLTFNPIIANAQIVNYGNPIIGDTLNWIKVSGIFKAQGGEQYLTLGNFKTNANTLTKQIVPTGYNGASYYIDDVSVIPLDSMCIKADAGRDTTIKTGDSAFIGSYTNGIDSVMWLQNGTIKKDSTRPGFWVKPSSNTFYVLQQVINGCFSSDTVTIGVLVPLKFTNYELRITNTVSGLPPSTVGEGLGVRSIWQTTNEINVSHFNIQRSTNGKDFETLGSIKANNKSYNEYSFIDYLKTQDQYPKTLYYRIQSIDKDGKISYSEVRNIEYLTINNQVAIYPNPTKGLVHISIPREEKGIWNIKVQDVIGRILQIKTTSAITKTMDLMVSNQPGFYYITLENKTTNKKIVEKVVVE